MAFFMGIDIGSVSVKGVITRDGEQAAWHLVPSGGNYRTAVDELKKGLLEKAGLGEKDISVAVFTGHVSGNLAGESRTAADLRCCARGINRLFPQARMVIDIQGQSSQVIRLGESGRVVDFAVSEKCASGSGRFLEIIANVLQVRLEDIGPLSLKSENPVAFTTGCAVFGESEAISRVAEGIPKDDILAGVHRALAEKVAALAGRVGTGGVTAISGGGGLDTGLVREIEKKLGAELLVPEMPRLVNALGAAVMAAE